MANEQSIRPISPATTTRPTVRYNHPALTRSQFYKVPGSSPTHRATGTLGRHMAGVDVGKAAGTGWYIDYHDQIEPTCLAIELALDEYMEAMAVMVGPMAAEKIAEIYGSGGQPKWVDNTPSWRKFKVEQGYDPRTMHMTGTLEERVAELSMHLKSWYDKNTGVFMFSGLGEGFQGAEYVWLHEFLGTPRGSVRGVQEFVRRPFIMQGLMMAIQALVGADEDIIDDAFEKIPQTVKNVEIKIAPAITPVESQYAWHSTRLHISLISLLWWIIPPSKMLMVFGASMDAISLAGGKLLEQRYLSLWVTAYVKGQIAGRAGLFATEKQARRKGRRYVWRGGG